MEEQAERLYNAVMEILRETRMGGLLVAVGDAQAKVPWLEADPRTRVLFCKLAARLAANLTAQAPKA